MRERTVRRTVRRIGLRVGTVLGAAFARLGIRIEPVDYGRGDRAVQAEHVEQAAEARDPERLHAAVLDEVVEVQAAVEVAHARIERAARHVGRRQRNRPRIGGGVHLAIIAVEHQHARRVRLQTERVGIGLRAAQPVARARRDEFAAVEQRGDQYGRERDDQQRDDQRHAAFARGGAADHGGVSVPRPGNSISRRISPRPANSITTSTARGSTLASVASAAGQRDCQCPAASR